MPAAYQIRVYEKQQLLHSAEVSDPVEIGRQFDDNEPLYCQSASAGRHRFVVARLNELNVSRQHVLLESAGEHRIRLTNLSKNRPVHVPGSTLRPNAAAAELTLPPRSNNGREKPA